METGGAQSTKRKSRSRKSGRKDGSVRHDKAYVAEAGAAADTKSETGPPPPLVEEGAAEKAQDIVPASLSAIDDGPDSQKPKLVFTASSSKDARNLSRVVRNPCPFFASNVNLRLPFLTSDHLSIHRLTLHCLFYSPPPFSIFFQAGPPRSPFADSTTSNERVFQFPPRFKGVTEQANLPSSSPESPLPLLPPLASPPRRFPLYKKASASCATAASAGAASAMDVFRSPSSASYGAKKASESRPTSSDPPPTTTTTARGSSSPRPTSSSEPPPSSRHHSSSTSNVETYEKKTTACHSAPLDVVNG